MVKPPIQVFGLNGRYATALYSAASKEKKLDAVEKELASLQVLTSPRSPRHILISNLIISETNEGRCQTAGVHCQPSLAARCQASGFDQDRCFPEADQSFHKPFE